jgi:hypothetical protein
MPRKKTRDEIPPIKEPTWKAAWETEDNYWWAAPGMRPNPT